MLLNYREPARNSKILILRNYLFLESAHIVKCFVRNLLCRQKDSPKNDTDLRLKLTLKLERSNVDSSTLSTSRVIRLVSQLSLWQRQQKTTGIRNGRNKTELISYRRYNQITSLTKRQTKTLSSGINFERD